MKDGNELDAKQVKDKINSEFKPDFELCLRAFWFCVAKRRSVDVKDYVKIVYWFWLDCAFPIDELNHADIEIPNCLFENLKAVESYFGSINDRWLYIGVDTEKGYYHSESYLGKVFFYNGDGGCRSDFHAQIVSEQQMIDFILSETFIKIHISDVPKHTTFE